MNVATHFARMKSLMEKQDINDAWRIFELDESRFSLRDTILGRSKCEIASGTRGNTRELKSRVSCNRVTNMPVISPAGQVLTPLVVPSGVEAKWRKRSDGKFESPADFLLELNFLNMSAVASVDSNSFFNWVIKFV